MRSAQLVETGGLRPNQTPAGLALSISLQGPHGEHQHQGLRFKCLEKAPLHGPHRPLPRQWGCSTSDPLWAPVSSTG